MARGHDLSEKTIATQVNDSLHIVVTQKETVQGSETDAVRRMSQAVYEWSALPNDIRTAISTMLLAYRQSSWQIGSLTPLLSLNIGQRLNALEAHLAVEIGTKALTNTQKFPFNNSQQSIALTNTQSNGDYIVMTEVVSAYGNVGEVEVTDKLTNGFKIAYTGSAPSVTIRYVVIGGFTE